MLTKDPYDFIEWNPEHDRSRTVVLIREEMYERRGTSTRKMEKQWVGYVYDLITLCTLATAVATLLSLFHN
ncbi:MAG TPA: hypothetical protein VKU38_05730 [Ktedonobacteraceae bacterium]|nr:hypothetical protein [Ktedonobacteraceae bacterium]